MSTIVPDVLKGSYFGLILRELNSNVVSQKMMTHDQWRKGLYYTLVIEAKTEVFVKFNRFIEEAYEKLKLSGHS
jgi:hypothetical protein